MSSGADDPTAHLEPNKRAEIETARTSLDSGEPHLFRKPFGAPWGVEPFLKWATIAYAIESLGIAPGAEILDVGCGEGWTSAFLAEAGYRPTGVDLAPARIQIPVARAARWFVDATVAVGDMDAYRDRLRGFAWQAARLAAADVAVAPQASVWLAARRPGDTPGQ